MPGFVCSHKVIVSGGDMGWLDSLLDLVLMVHPLNL